MELELNKKIIIITLLLVGNENPDILEYFFHPICGLIVSKNAFSPVDENMNFHAESGLNFHKKMGYDASLAHS